MEKSRLSHPFLKRLEQGVVLADGAMGTLLYERGITFDRSFDLLNLQEPALVQSIHRDYIRAGAELIETNTFGANRVRLAAHGEVQDARRVNRAGAQLARNAREEVGEAVFVAGGGRGARENPAPRRARPAGRGRPGFGGAGE